MRPQHNKGNDEAVVDNWLIEENQSLRELVGRLLQENEQLREQLENEKQISRWREREGEVIYSTK